MDMTDIVTIDGDTDLSAAQFLNRDCAFPITRIEKTLKRDDVLAQMPIFIGYWNDGTIQPVLLTQTFNIDTSVVVTDCDSAVVNSDITEGELIVPNMAKFKLESNTLDLTKLIPAFCRNRNILPNDRRNLLNADGTINTGNPYAINFARFVYSTIADAMGALISRKALRGDASDAEFAVDGFYTQLENGWEQGAPSIPAELNKAIQIDWGLLTGAYATGGTPASASPDDSTLPGMTIDLWGETVNVPEDYNLAMFLDDFLFPAIEAHWANVDSYEIHVPSGTSRCIVRSAACIQPCGNNVALGLWDADLRNRYADLANRNVVRLYPSGRELGILESPQVESQTMWVGPRSIGGLPTYGLFFRDMDEMFGAIGALGQTYGLVNGLPMDDEPLLIDIIPQVEVPFEARVMRQSITKQSVDCVKTELMTIFGVLTQERHLWIKLSNIDCATYVEQMKSGVMIDGTALES